jgi:hypothetical protein
MIVVVAMIVIMVMVMMVPRVTRPKMSVIPVSAALVVSMNPPVMLVVAGHPEVMPSPVPELWAFVIPPVADVNFKRDRLCGRIKHRARRDQDRQ